MSVKLTTEMIQSAQETERLYGVPASVTLGQLMLESGGSNKGGLSTLAYKYNNFFGVTAGSSWNGKTVSMSNKNGTDTQTYRVYESVYDSIKDHAEVLMNERYRKYTQNASTVREYVDGIAKGGYATDTSYADKVMSVIKSNNLTSYDSESWQNINETVNSKPDDTANSKSDDTENVDIDLKWWGDIINLVICILFVILAVVFFCASFKKSINISKVIDKVKG